MISRILAAAAGLYGAGLGVYYLLQRGHLPVSLRAVKPELPYAGPRDPMMLSLGWAVENAFGIAFVAMGAGLCYSAWRHREWTVPFAAMLTLSGATFGVVLIESASYFGLLEPRGLQGGALFLVAALLGVATVVTRVLPRSAVDTGKQL